MVPRRFPSVLPVDCVVEPPSLSGQDYGMMIGVGVSVFALVVIFIGLSVYLTKRKMRPRVRLAR